MLTNKQGIAFAILAPLLYALKSAAIKFAPQARVEVFVFLRFFFDFLLLSPFFVWHWKKLLSKQLLLHFIRAVFVTISIYCSVLGIRNLALVDAILLEGTLPLFIPLIVWVWHREKITLASCCTLLLGFSSLFLLLKPKLDILHWASLASIATGFTSALTAVSIKSLSKTEHPLAILFYFNLFSGLLSLPLCMHYQESFTCTSWWPFILISAFGILFQYAITKAYSLSPPHVVGSLAYFSVLFSALIGWFVWQESLDVWQILGGITLISSGLLMIQQSTRKALPERRS